MAGRPPKPKLLKKLEGNRGRRDLDTPEPVGVIGLPEKPAGLGPVASREWDRIGPSLVAMRVLTTSDGAAFAEYCELVERSQEIRMQLRESSEPLVDGRENPLYRLQRENGKALGAYLTRFGLDPSSRSKIVAAKDTAGASGDPWAATA